MRNTLAYLVVLARPIGPLGARSLDYFASYLGGQARRSNLFDGECELDPDEIGMSLPRTMSLDPTGSHLYVAGNASDAISALLTGQVFTDGFESGDTAGWSATVPPAP